MIAPLTKEQRERIIERYTNGEGVLEISRSMDIRYQTVYGVIHKKNIRIVRVKLERKEYEVLASIAFNNRVPIDAYVRGIVVDAIADEQERIANALQCRRAERHSEGGEAGKAEGAAAP